VMLVFAVISAVLRQFVISEPINNGDFFNDVVGIGDVDSGGAAIGVGSDGSAVVQDDDGANATTNGEVEGQPGQRTAVGPANLDWIPVLEVRMFLGKMPLTRGTVVFSHDSKEDPMRGIPAMQVVTLDGTHEARIALPRLRGVEGEVRIAASYAEKKPGYTRCDWNFNATIPAPKPGQRWIGPDIVLESEQSYLICSGKVVDEAGKAIPGSVVALGSATSFTPGFFAAIGVGQHLLGGLATASDGSFELRNTSPSQKDKLSLQAQAPGHVLPRQVQFRPGAQGLRIVIHRAGSVSGSLILPPGLDRTWLMVGLLDEKGGKLVSRIKLNGMGSPCSWTLKPIPAGRYTLRVGYLTMDQSLVEFPGIEVSAGHECRDVHFQNLDLRGFLEVICVRVVPERPKGPLQCTVLCRRSGGAIDRSGRTIKLEPYGMAELVIPTAGADLTVKAAGYKQIHRPRVTEDTTFELERLATLPRGQIQLAGGFPKNLAANIWMELVPAVGGGPGIAAESFSLEGSYHFKELGPGPYKVRIYLKKERDKDAPRLFPDRDRTVQVRPIAERQEWEISFDHNRMLRFAEEGKKRMNAPRRRR
jgi:hypothetical protein